MIKINNELRDKCCNEAVKWGLRDERYHSTTHVLLIIKTFMKALALHKADKFANREKYDNSDLRFEFKFQYNINGTFEDKLADLVILCLDFAGIKKLDMSFFDKPPIPLSVMDVDGSIRYFDDFVLAGIGLLYEKGYTEYAKIIMLINMLLSYAKGTGIDLLWHIEYKIKYLDIVYIYADWKYINKE